MAASKRSQRGPAGPVTRPWRPAAEQLEARAMLAVTVGLKPASDSGAKGDLLTNVVKPVLVGSAAPKTVVSILVDNTPIGTVKAGGTGAWTFAKLPRLADGTHVVSAVTADGTATANVKIDTQKPTATIAYDNTQLDRVTVTLSKPVSGLTASAFRLSGRPVGLPAFANIALTDAKLKPYIGASGVTLTPSQDGMTYTVSCPDLALYSGSYTLTLAKNPKIVDAAGNALSQSAATSGTIV